MLKALSIIQLSAICHCYFISRKPYFCSCTRFLSLLQWLAFRVAHNFFKPIDIAKQWQNGEGRRGVKQLSRSHPETLPLSAEPIFSLCTYELRWLTIHEGLRLELTLGLEFFRASWIRIWKDVINWLDLCWYYSYSWYCVPDKRRLCSCLWK
jgi:hypothetical protein